MNYEQEINELPLKTVSLFSGIGGFELASEPVGGFNVRQFVELNPDAQKVLAYHFPGIPIHADIRTYHPTEQFDCIWGGFPCTGTSTAGKREGLDNEESELWWEYLRIVIEAQPRFVVIENPEGFINNGLRTVLASLRMASYSWDNPQLISASWVGAPHRRNRLFVIAYPNYLSEIIRQRGRCWSEQIGSDIEIAANSYRTGCERIHRQEFSQSTGCNLSTVVPTRADESRRSWMGDGLPAWLGGVAFDGWWGQNPAPFNPGIPPHTPSRRSAVSRYGLSVVPAQAMVPLLRVRYLASIVTTNGI